MSTTWTGTRPIGIAAPVAITAALLALAMVRFDTISVLGVLTGAGVLGLMALSPHAAMNLGSALLFANVPAALRGAVPGAQVLAGAFLVLLGMAAVRRILIEGRIHSDRTMGLMVLFAAVMLASSFQAVSRDLAYQRIAQFGIEGVLLYWMTLQAVRSREAIRGVMWSVTLTAALLAGLSIYQMGTGHYSQNFGGLAQRQLRHEIDARAAGRTTSAGAAGVRVADRAAGPVGDPNRYAQNLLLALPLGLYLASRQKRLGRRALVYGVSAIVAAGIVLTYSRGAFLAIGLIAVAAGFWRVVHRLRLIVALAVAALVMAIAAPTYVTRIGTIVNSLALVDDAGDREADGAIRGRATEMLAGFWTFVDHPLLGVGPGQYTPFYSETYQQRSDVKFRSLSVPREPHNLLISIAAETGLVGLTVFLVMVGWLVRDLATARRVLRDVDPDLSRLSTAFLFSVIAYLCCGLFLHLAYERYLWFLLGAAGASLHIARRTAFAATVSEAS